MKYAIALIVLVLFAGCLTPDKYLPDKCTIQGGFSCMEYKIDGSKDQLRFIVVNDLGVDAEDVSVELASDECTVTSENPVVIGTLENRGDRQLTFQCESGELKDAVKANITVRYHHKGITESRSMGRITGMTES